MRNKEINIKIKMGNDKMASIISTTGYRKDVISDQLELLGIIENMKFIIRERLNKLLDINFDGNEI